MPAMPPNSMHFILDGRVGIKIDAGEGRTTRVRSLGRYTTIGEMGLVSHATRSATIQAEVASILYVLSADQFEAIKTDDPALGQKLLTYFVSVMAERLSFANRTIAVLRRYAGWEGGQHGWDEPIRTTFVSGW